MKREHSLLTNFALNELDAQESEQVSSKLKSDDADQGEVEEIRRTAQLIEQALAREAMPTANAPRKPVKWVGFSAAAAVAAILMVVAFPHLNFRNGNRAMSIEEDAFAESFSPGVDKEAIRQVVRSHLKEIRKCYADVSKMQPSLSGKVLVRFSFSENGVVSEAMIEKSTLQSQSVESCLLERFKAWKFSGAPNGVKAVVDYPFVFSKK